MQNFRPNMVMVWAGVFVFWLGLSIIDAYYPLYAMQWGVEYLKIFAILFIAMAVMNQWWQIEALAIMILLTLGYVAWEVNALYFFDGRMDIFHYGLGGLDNNGAGLMLAMGIPFAYVYGVRATKKWQRAMAWTLGVLIIHAMLMSYSRGAMVSTLVAVLWILFHHRPRYKSLVIALVTFAIISVLAGQEIRERFFSTDNFQTDGSAQSRFESWAAAWQIATDNPFTGQGVRNSVFFSQNYGADRVGRTIHSQYLQIAADSGIPAMVSYLILLIVTFWGLRKTRLECLTILGDLPPPMAQSPRQQRASCVMTVAMGIESSLIIFVVGGAFLSLEMFELPWILIAMTGVLPVLAQEYMDQASDVAIDRTAPRHTPVKLIPNIPVTRRAIRSASLQGAAGS
jgi:probable O-glycosylation ligase (exosortase A-associated)